MRHLWSTATAASVHELQDIQTATSSSNLQGNGTAGCVTLREPRGSVPLYAATMLTRVMVRPHTIL